MGTTLEALNANEYVPAQLEPLGAPDEKYVEPDVNAPSITGSRDETKIPKEL